MVPPLGLVVIAIRVCKVDHESNPFSSVACLKTSIFTRFSDKQYVRNYCADVKIVIGMKLAVVLEESRVERGLEGHESCSLDISTYSVIV